MQKLISAEVFIDVYAKVAGVWVYVGSYWPEFDVRAKAHHGIAHLRKLAVQYMQQWFSFVGASEIKSVLAS